MEEICVRLESTICGINRTKVWVLILRKLFQPPVLGCHWSIPCFWGRDSSTQIFDWGGRGLAVLTAPHCSRVSCIYMFVCVCVCVCVCACIYAYISPISYWFCFSGGLKLIHNSSHHVFWGQPVGQLLFKFHLVHLQASDAFISGNILEIPTTLPWWQNSHPLTLDVTEIFRR